MKKLKLGLSLIFTLAILVVPLAGTTGASACSKGQTQDDSGLCEAPDPAVAATSCGVSQGEKVNKSQDQANCEKIFTDYLLPATNLLSAVVGVVAVAMIIYGGIEFSSSGGDPQKVASGKNHITNAIIALVAFLFLWAFLNFIIPGGLLNGTP